MLIIVIINVNDLDLDSVIQCLYLINNLQESLINLFIYLFIYLFKCMAQANVHDCFVQFIFLLF